MNNFIDLFLENKIYISLNNLHYLTYKINIKPGWLFYIVVLTVALSGSILSQSDTQGRRFIRIFNEQSFAGKVKMFDTLNGELKLKFYPLVKSDLEKIKIQATKDKKQSILNTLQKIEGELCFQSENYSKCIVLYTDLLTNKKIDNFYDSVDVLHRLKNSYTNMNALDKAINIHRILQKLKEVHPELNYWLLYPNLSVIFYNMGLYEEALDQQLKEFKDIANDKKLLLSYYNNRGLFFYKYGNVDSAIYCYGLAKKYFFEINTSKKLSLQDEFTIGLIDGNIGQALVKKKEYKKAIPLLKRDIESSIKSNELQNAAYSEIDLAKCYINLKDFNTAKKLLESANTKLSNTKDRNYLALLKLYADYHNQTANYKVSNQYYAQYIILKDSIEKQEHLNTLISSQVLYQLSEKESLIQDKQQKIAEKNALVERQNTILLFLLLSGVLLVAIIIFVTIQLKKATNQKKLLELKNKKIKTRNSIIRQSLSDKDLLVKEIHHRVKNNLQIVSSLLKLQASKTTNEEIKNSLNDAQDRINSMSLLHQLLYKNNQMSRLSFDGYLSNLISKISESFISPNKQINITTNLIDLELDIDTAIPLGLITNELISNAYKHAFAKEHGEIKVTLSKIVKDTYSLKIEDNGVGIPHDFDIESLDSLGLDIVVILTEQINAELKMYNDNGAHFEIVFKAI